MTSQVSRKYQNMTVSDWNTINDIGATEEYCYVWNKAVSSTGPVVLPRVLTFIDNVIKKGKK